LQSLSNEQLSVLIRQAKQLQEKDFTQIANINVKKPNGGGSPLAPNAAGAEDQTDDKDTVSSPKVNTKNSNSPASGAADEIHAPITISNDNKADPNGGVSPLASNRAGNAGQTATSPTAIVIDEDQHDNGGNAASRAANAGDKSIVDKRASGRQTIKEEDVVICENSTMKEEDVVIIEVDKSASLKEPIRAAEPGNTRSGGKRASDKRTVKKEPIRAAEPGNRIRGGKRASDKRTVKKEVLKKEVVDNSKVGKSERDKQTSQTKDSIDTVPCKIPNGKWEMITFDLAAVRERKTGLFDVTTEIQTSFLGRGSFATDVQSLTGK